MDNFTVHTTSPQSNSDEEEFYPAIQIPFYVFSVLLFLLGCGGNGLVVFVILKYRKDRDITLTFLLHLAITDFITAFVSSFYALSYDTGIRNDSFLSCIIHEQIVTYMIFVSQLVLAAVSFDRYIAVCYNVRYPKIVTKSVVNMLLSIAWIAPLIFTVFPIFKFNNWNIVQRCMYHNLFHDWVYDMYSTLMIILMIFPLGFYVMVLSKARQFYRKFSPAQIQGINANTMRVFRKKQSITNGKIMGVFTIVFMLCWFPFPIFQYQFGIDFNMNAAANKVAMLIIINLGLMNSIINPLIYAWQKKDFQAEARRILNCTKCCRGATCYTEQLNIPSTSHEDNRGNKVTCLNTASNATFATTVSRQTESSVSRKNATRGDDSILLNEVHVNRKIQSTSKVIDSPRPKTLQVKPYIVQR